MCGIAGLGGGGWPSGSFEALFEGIGHRGPDHQGVWCQGSLQLGMNRLRLRGPNVALPITVPTGAVAFNGQVYGAVAHNGTYSPLQNGLDGEISILLNGEVGADGMYAWALVSEDGRTVTLRSDPDFIKPMFYRLDKRGFAFCSEPGPLMRLGGGRCRLDRTALAELFAYGWYLDDSLFAEGIRFTATEDAVLSFEGVRPLDKHYQPAPSNEGATPVERLRIAMHESVLRCTMGAGPFGLALSGGLDSTILAYELNSLGIEDLVTISVCAGDDDGIADLHELELPSGGAWERWRHRVVRIENDQDFLSRFRASTLSFAQPSTMSSLPLYHALAEAAAEEGVRVLITGEGVDEVFGGYSSYAKLPNLACPIDYYSYPHRELLVRRLFGDALDSKVRARFRERFESCTDIRVVEREIRLKRLLLRSDLCLMARSIEGRVPFLHNGIPQIGLSVPWSEAVRPPGKNLLRTAYADWLGPRAAVRKTRFKATDSQLFDCLTDAETKQSVMRNSASVFGRDSARACLETLMRPGGFDADLASLLLTLSFLIDEGWFDVDA